MRASLSGARHPEDVLVEDDGVRPLRCLTIVLIRPSKYDDDGYVVRFRKGFLPSNTLSCLLGLTEDVRRKGILGSVRLETQLLDDTVQPIPVRAIARRAKRRGNRTLVCLAGVQTNQFSRASDLALKFRREDVDVLIGGFHVSGSLSVLPTVPREIRELTDVGVCIVAGEVEGRWAGILQDAAQGRLQPSYDFLGDPPALAHEPLPAIHEPYLRRFLTSNFGTIDAGRGCPFSCSFCTIIHVQGRKMRCRDPRALLRSVRDNYRDHGISFYFFTDDNFARNPAWERILDGLISLREVEGLPLEFVMQADVLSYRIPNFIRKARRAGCTQVFLGLESLNPENIVSAGKNQNDVGDVANLVAAYHAEGIMTHAAYIIGLPFDTPASVRADVERLKQTGVKQASFFMLMPLPGSDDHLEKVRSGARLDTDFNRYDGAHPTAPHPQMRGEEWVNVYREAWNSFYGFDNMREVLRHTSADRYWNVFKNFLWAKICMKVEGVHPMMGGLWRRWERSSRRPIFPIEGRRAYAVRRGREAVRKAREWLRLLVEMRELWLQTGEGLEGPRGAREPAPPSASGVTALGCRGPHREGLARRAFAPVREAKISVQFLVALFAPGIR